MAEIFLAPLLQVFYEKLASPAFQKLADIWDLKDEVQKLQQTLPIIQALLEDAEERQISFRAVQIWLSKLNDAACKAEDLLEEFTRRGYKIHDLIFDLAQYVTRNDHVILENDLPQSDLAKIRHLSIVRDYRSSLIPEALYRAKHLRTLLVVSGGGFGGDPAAMFSHFSYLRMLDLSGCDIKLPESIEACPLCLE
ncbi:hypothetical protein F0562_012196 [Nyssa sinensis]|uniref:Disease resistance N-terminal domain-containing protein n=1 Tax=Nyssa sinensis TaxID=561372 RepID=A0A5J4ZUD7_9ASTE|nr:hypothetical protein F0562_012196 [Nyssa sinensis]